MKKTILNQHICNLPSKNYKKTFKKSFLAISVLLANSMVYADCSGTGLDGLNLSDGSECIFDQQILSEWFNQVQGTIYSPAILAIGDGTKVVFETDGDDFLSILNYLGNTGGIVAKDNAEVKFNNTVHMEIGKGGDSITINDNAKVIFKDNLSIYMDAFNIQHSLYGINITNTGEFEIKGDLKLESEELHSGSLISSSGTVKLNTATLRVIEGGSGAGISIGESGNNSSNALIHSDGLVNIETQGNELTDAAILGKYKGYIDLESANIKTQGGAGIYLSDANVNIRNKLNIKTEKEKAYGIYITDGSGDFNAGSGQITTSGDEAHGLFETKHSSNINRYLNLDVTTNGKNADAVHLVSNNNDINFKTNATITTIEEGSKGIFAQAGSANKINIILENGASISSNSHSIYVTNAKESLVSLGQASMIKSKNGNGINLSNLQNANIMLQDASILSKDHAINLANGNESIISLGQGSKIESSNGNGINLSDLQNAKIILEQASILSNGNAINIANANESIVSLGEGSKLESRNGNGINLSNLQNANIMLQDASILSKDHAINIANANESLISLGERSKLESRNGNGINLSNLQKVNMKIEKDASILTSGHSISIADTKESIVLLDEGSKLESQNGNGIDLSNLKEGSQSTVYNNGDITVTDGHYAILGGSANDNVKLLGGKVTGDINLGDGNNYFEFSGGTLNGKVLFGMGNAHAILKDKADISEMSRIEGGEGTNSLELSNIKLTGYTADVDNLDKGVNLNNWDNIFLSGNTVFTQSGDLFSSNEANILTRDAGLFNTNKTGTLTISSTATWNMGDNVTSLNIAGNVINSGILNVGDAGQTGRVLSIGGDYEGKGGTVVLNNLASGDEVSTDLIKIAGDAKGVTNLIVHNVGGLGDQTKGDGVEIVQVGGVSDSNAFILNGAVTAGNYEYLLNKGDKSGTNQNWYLRSYKDNNNQVLYNPALGTYLSNQTVAVQMFRQTFFDRLGSLSSSSMSDASEQFYWMINRINHNYYKSIHDKLNNHINSYSVQFGGDINVWALDNDDYFHLGIMGGYGDSRSRSVSNQTKTRTDGEVRGYAIGVYGTYFSNKYTDLGFYVDMMSRMGWYRNDITGHSQVATKNYHSTVWSNSIELGYTLPLITGEEYQLIAIPQGQFTYNLYNAHNQNDKNKLKVSNNDADGLDIRLGSRFIVKGISIVEPFVEVNWLSTTAKNQLDFNGTTFKDGFAKNRFETKLGLQNSYNENWKILMQIVGQYGKNNFHSYEGQLNVDYNF
ncbi:hypothetical protein A9G11_06935 [Gilliamella sp. wkB108]|uniref:autotransporter family protein n=1 Tax=Gilliamella sp. wkB108 TaxID=3120256 RepID=UPI00080E1691|nr:autotransporter outer membrane beta-barrel domain-containing protein [Gilliamella apicola]OCG22630.1 hypothetical protein A9G11_06935 [Gilliamella apicola]